MEIYKFYIYQGSTLESAGFNLTKQYKTINESIYQVLNMHTGLVHTFKTKLDATYYIFESLYQFSNRKLYLLKKDNKYGVLDSYKIKTITEKELTILLQQLIHNLEINDQKLETSLDIKEIDDRNILISEEEISQLKATYDKFTDYELIEFLPSQWRKIDTTKITSLAQEKIRELLRNIDEIVNEYHLTKEKIKEASKENIDWNKTLNEQGFFLNLGKARFDEVKFKYYNDGSSILLQNVNPRHEKSKFKKELTKALVKLERKK